MHLTFLSSTDRIHKTKKSERLFYSIVVFLIYLMWPTPNMAQQSSIKFETDSDLLNFHQDLEKPMWLPEERYNTFNGALNYSRTDLSIPGNGKLPIEIIRTFSQDYYKFAPSWDEWAWPYDSFGNMGLAIPVVALNSEYLVGARNGGYKGCKGLITSREYQKGTGSRVMRGPLFFSDGKQEAKFYDVNQSNAHLASFAYVSGGRFDYISVNNWGIKCHDNVSGVPLGSSKLTVYSPDGIRYKMQHMPIRPDRNEWSSREKIVYRVTQVLDPYGNSLKYHYERFSYGADRALKLVKISASDGRQVDLTYKRLRVEDRIYRGVYYYYWRIDSIISNGTPHPRVLKYEYGRTAGLTVTENDIFVRKYDFDRKNGLLGRITTQTGAEIVYSYATNPYTDFDSFMEDKLVAPDIRYAKLEKRTFKPAGESAGKVFTFEQHWLSKYIFKRVIHTDNSVFEYQYMVSSVSRYSLNRWDERKIYDGTLRAYKVFEKNSYPVSPSLHRGYEYKTLYRISDRNRVDALRIVPSKITTEVFPDKNSYVQNKAFYDSLIFVKEYFSHDSHGYPIVIVDSAASGAQRLTNISYQKGYFFTWMLGKPIEVNVDNKEIITIAYNRQGDIQWKKRNGVTLFQNTYHTDYPGKGELRSVQTGAYGVTEYANYFRGKAQTITDPMGRVRAVEVNSDGTTKSETRFNDHLKTEYHYDGLRRLKRVDPARQESNRRYFTWGANHRQRLEADDKDQFQLLAFDEYGRTTIDSRVGRRDTKLYSTVEYKYDSEGRLIFESHPQARTLVETKANTGMYGRYYEYDALGRIVKITVSARVGKNSVTKYSYGNSASGNLLITQTDGRGLNTVTEYWSFGKPTYNWPVSITEADGTKTIIERDDVGNILSHGRSNVTTYYRYNDRNMVSQIERPEDGITKLKYDDYGELIQRSNNGRDIVYSYYADSKLKRIEYTSPEGDSLVKTYFYDRYGNLNRLLVSGDHANRANELVYTYDTGNNLLSESLVVDGHQFTMKYEYDERSNRKTIQFPNGHRYSLSPNRFGDPTTIKAYHPDQKVIYEHIEYNSNESVKLLQRDGHQIVNEIDLGLRPKTFKLNEYGSGRNMLLATKDYFYDDANNVSRINDHANNRYETFEYDARNRLASVSGNSGNWRFYYLPTDDIDFIDDGFSFLRFEYDDDTKRLRRVVQNGVSRNFDYDSHGNIDRHEQISDSGATLSRELDFDAASQLASMSDGTRFVYDARGLRVKKEKSGAIYSLYDKEKRLVYRADIGTGVTSEYFYVKDKLVARRDVDKSVIRVDHPPNDVPGVPLAVSPTGSGASSDPTYTWQPVSAATHYYIDVRKSGDDTVLLYKKYSAAEAGCTDGRSQCVINKSDSPMSGNNIWRVRSENSTGASKWSNWESFNVGG